MFSAETVKHFVFQQEQMAPVMIHAVSSKLAHSVERLQGVAVLAAGVDDKQKEILKVILYMLPAIYTRTYSTKDGILKEINEGWLKPDELVAGFHNPFTHLNTQMINRIPSLDFNMTYSHISKSFNRHCVKWERKQAKPDVEFSDSDISDGMSGDVIREAPAPAELQDDANPLKSKNGRISLE